MSRMLAEPAYARWVGDGAEPANRFADEVLRTHRRTNRPRDARGRFQLPWPRALGTQPWALARELPGRHRVARVRSRSHAWQRIVRADQPVPLYVGSDLLPRHVVLVTGRDADDRVRVYEPTAGAALRVDRADFLAGSLDLAGWDRPWFLVLPGT